MIYLGIFFSLLLLTIIQFGLLMSFKRAHILTNFLKLPEESKTPKIVFSVFTVIYFLFLVYFLIQLSSPHPNPVLFNTLAKKEKAQAASTEPYQVLEHDTTASIENMYILYKGSDTSESTLEAFAFTSKTSMCRITCTINLYDDLNAYTIDRERVHITSDLVMKQWNQAHYVYVANHYLGYLSNQLYSDFSYYPYKDWYYTTLVQKRNNN